MKLEDQVCSLKLGIILHKLHVTAPSIFYYEWTGGTKLESWKDNKPDFCEDNIAAYSVAELGGMLPMEDCESGKSAVGTVAYTKGKWACIHVLDDFKTSKTYANTEADARAKMLIYLIENKLLSPSTP